MTIGDEIGRLFVWVAIVAAAVVATFAISRLAPSRWMARQPIPPALVPLPEAEQRHVAEFIERARFTGGGMTCVVLLVLWNLLFPLLFFSAKSVLQEAVMVLLWIGGNQVFIGGAAIGRTRSYFMRRNRP